MTIDEIQHIDWELRFETGIEVIDYQHRCLLKIINKILALNQFGEELNEMLQYLKHWSDVHFAYEEKLFTAAQYPLNEVHACHHDEMLEDYSNFCEQLADEKDVMVQIKNWLYNWLMDHIAVEDQKYAPYVLMRIADEGKDWIGEIPIPDFPTCPR